MVVILCDFCDRDITSTEAMPGFRLHLRAEALPHVGFVYTVLVRPPIRTEKYFCGLSCLGDWLKERGGKE